MDWIPVAGPWVTEKEVRYTADAAANGWYANHNVYPDRFEKGFAEYLGVAHATSLPSCTSALHLALAGLGIGPATRSSSRTRPGSPPPRRFRMSAPHRFSPMSTRSRGASTPPLLSAR